MLLYIQYTECSFRSFVVQQFFFWRGVMACIQALPRRCGQHGAASPLRNPGKKGVWASMHHMHVLYDYIILWCLFVCRSMAPFKASQSETGNFQAPISGCRTTPSRNAWRRSWIRWMWRSDGAAANCAILTDTEEWGSSERASWISWISMNIYIYIIYQVM